MTEEEWLHGWCYRRMYDQVRSRATTRQARLYMVACCRLKAAEFFDPRIPLTLEAAEWCADDPRAEAVANAYWERMVTSPRRRLPRTGPKREVARRIWGSWELLNEWRGSEHYRDARHAVAHAAFLCLRRRPHEVFTGGEGDAAELCVRAIDAADALASGVNPEEAERDEQQTETGLRRAIAGLLRYVFGNPFRAISLNPSWRTPTVLGLARAAYDNRSLPAGHLEPCRLAVLADALEESGCADPAILGHLRNVGPHARGCFLLDALLGET